MTLLLEIVTPDGPAYRDTVDHVVLPTRVGELDVLPGHIPVMELIEPGALLISRGGSTESLAVASGFAEVLGDKVSVLTEAAIDVREIDEGDLEAARRAAEKELAEAKERGEDPSALQELETKAQIALASKIARERRG